MRNIFTKKTLKLIRELKKYEPNSTYHGLPINWEGAVDEKVFGNGGREFIDFTSTIFVANVGHRNRKVVSEIKHQLDFGGLMHSYTYPTEIRLSYLKELTKFTGFEKAFLLSTGAEATEAACKIMRQASKRPYLLSFEGAMHGKTALAEALKGTPSPDNYKIRHLSLSFTQRDLDLMAKTKFVKDLAGIMIESYRGWDALFFYPEQMQLLCNWAKKYNVLVCFDEIQAGFGRTGKLFCYEHYGVKPDLVCCGKGMGGGFPLSCVLGSTKLLDTPNDLSSTHSGNPLACAAGKAVLRAFREEDILSHVRELEPLFVKMVGDTIKYPNVIRTNAKGLVGAIVFESTDIADRVALNLLNRGILVVHTGKESIKLGPPLIIKRELLLKGLQEVHKAIEEVMSGKN